jgi:hypothetical protein
MHWNRWFPSMSLFCESLSRLIWQFGSVFFIVQWIETPPGIQNGLPDRTPMAILTQTRKSCPMINSMIKRIICWQWNTSIQVQEWLSSFKYWIACRVSGFNHGEQWLRRDWVWLKDGVTVSQSFKDMLKNETPSCVRNLVVWVRWQP